MPLNQKNAILKEYGIVDEGSQLVVLSYRNSWRPNQNKTESRSGLFCWCGGSNPQHALRKLETLPQYHCVLLWYTIFKFILNPKCFCFLFWKSCVSVVIVFMSSGMPHVYRETRGYPIKITVIRSSLFCVCRGSNPQPSLLNPWTLPKYHCVLLWYKIFKLTL